MSRTKNIWLGWACLLVNGYELLAALATGRMGGILLLANPDAPASFARQPGLFLLGTAFYFCLCGLGIWLILGAPGRGGRQA